MKHIKLYENFNNFETIVNDIMFEFIDDFPEFKKNIIDGNIQYGNVEKLDLSDQDDSFSLTTPISLTLTTDVIRMFRAIVKKSEVEDLDCDIIIIIPGEVNHDEDDFGILYDNSEHITISHMIDLYKLDEHIDKLIEVEFSFNDFNNI